SNCSASYASGAVVDLTAVAASGSTFEGWSGGGCSGTGICSLTLAESTTISASFATSGASSAPVILAPAIGATGNGALNAPTLANLDSDPDLELIIGTVGTGVVVHTLPNSANARVLVIRTTPDAELHVPGKVHRAQRLRDLPEIRVVERRVGSREDRRVGQVECLEPDLQTCTA